MSKHNPNKNFSEQNIEEMNSTTQHGHDEHVNHHEHEHCNCEHEHQHKHEHCDCEHEHQHKHERCDCEHEHQHEHNHCDSEHEHQHNHEHCGCGHNHHHEHHHEAAPSKKHITGKDDDTIVYLVENLGCANCAAKMEDKINSLPGVTCATLTFATKQLKVSGKNIEGLYDTMQSICSSIESEVVLTKREGRTTAPSNDKTETKHSVIEIIIGVAFFIGGLFTEESCPMACLILCLIGYLVLGRNIIKEAAKNLFKGHVLDENFLMSIATLGAFAISDYPEAVGVMLFYRVGELFEDIAVGRSRKQIMDAVDMRPETVNLVSGQDITVIPAEDAAIGDILVIRPGDRIPLDGLVVEGESRIDTSPVTGEPVPVKASVGDTIISGCVNTSGLLKMHVEKTLDESMVTKILDSVENAAASKPKIDRFITKFARIYTPFVVALSIFTAIVPSLFTGNWAHWIYTALTFLVISCPCALVLSVPLAFFAGIGAGSKQGILFKGGISLEAMCEVKAIVMDKTGTITKGNFAVQKIVSVSDLPEAMILSYAAACEATSTHPIGSSIVSAFKETNQPLLQAASLEEISGHGIKAMIDGKTVLCGNSKLMEQHHVNIAAYQPDNSGTEVLLAINGKLTGYLVISDTIKEDAIPAIQSIKKLGITTAMLTGDSQAGADMVAAKTGIDIVRAKCLPEDKLHELNAIRNQYGSVMFVGDGINDAPVLAGADVGAAMGSGADAAIEAADVVFMTSGMTAIPQALKIAKNANRIARQNVVFALIIKALVMVLGLCGIANMWLAVFADTGVAMLCVLNSVRILYQKN